ncbi:MAG: type III polyketide synthase, partial [Jiangellaceae bacterium]|nr:type III polyketide synthase [Jiangellaceae bacterium]
TGYAAPGLDVILADEFGMTRTTQRLHIGHMGCYAALPGLVTVSDAATARGLTSLLLCVELPSLHVQPRHSMDVEQVVSQALFADAAAAAVVAPGVDRLHIVGFTCRTDYGHAQDMRWDVTDSGFRMGLSPRVPDLIAGHVRHLVDELLAPHCMGIDDVARWVIHPGGPKIIDLVAEQLGLDTEVKLSRDVLSSYGNCSSATVLLILEHLLRADPPSPGDHVVVMAFGPGLTLYAALLRAGAGTG